MEPAFYGGLLRNVRTNSNTGSQKFDIYQPGSKTEFKDFFIEKANRFYDRDGKLYEIKDGEYLEFLAEGDQVVQLIKHRLTEPARDEELKYLEIAVDTSDIGDKVRQLAKELPATFVFNDYGLIFSLFIKEGFVVDGGLDCFSMTNFKNKLGSIKGLSYTLRNGLAPQFHSSSYDPNGKSTREPLVLAKKKKKAKYVKSVSPDMWDFI